MTLAEIKTAVLAGRPVYWVHEGYEVMLDHVGQWLIKCHANGNCIGLTWLDGVTVNGEPDQFFMKGA